MTLSHLPRQRDAQDPPSLTITVDVQPPVLEVRLAGEIDLACTDLLEAVTSVELADVTRVRVDLSALEFSDLAGLRALLAFRATHEAGRREVELVGARPVVRKLFELCGAGASLVA